MAEQIDLLLGLWT